MEIKLVEDFHRASEREEWWGWSCSHKMWYGHWSHHIKLNLLGCIWLFPTGNQPCWMECVLLKYSRIVLRGLWSLKTHEYLHFNLSQDSFWFYIENNAPLVGKKKNLMPLECLKTHQSFANNSLDIYLGCGQSTP